MTLLLVVAETGLVQGQVGNLVGEWKVVRQDAGSLPCPNCSPAENWIRALPGATFIMTPSVIPPLAMVRKDLGYTYTLSSPTITIWSGTPENPSALGFLQLQFGRRFEGELASAGCWIHLSLEESEDGSTLSGSARINTKISTRSCRNTMSKEFKNGAPFNYALVRLR
jgi:hypothetical protein